MNHDITIIEPQPDHLQPTTRLIGPDRQDLRGIGVGVEVDGDHCCSDRMHDLVDREPMLEGRTTELHTPIT